MATSSDGTTVLGVGASITDAAGNVWAIAPDYRITVNGKVDPTTANVDELGYSNGLVWQKNIADDWYSKASPTAAWTGSSQHPPFAITSVSGNLSTAAGV